MDADHPDRVQALRAILLKQARKLAEADGGLERFTPIVEASQPRGIRRRSKNSIPIIFG